MLTMADIASDRHIDPDAQAAVTDFLDYTEYLPSDLIRSLTLIRGLDQRYLDSADAVNGITRTYGSLPSIPPAEKPDAQDLRSQISSHLDHALSARENSYAEACRLFDVVDRHHNRLKSIIAKLHAIPKPPSRDPSPQPPASTQQAAKRSRSGRKLENGTSTSTRLTLIPPRGGNAVASAILKRPRGRRVTVPGEVMPPYDPDSPIASTEVSDWESPPPQPSPPPRPVLKFKPPRPPSTPAPSVSQLKQRAAVTTEKSRPAREPTETYRKPTPPPEDAEIGSKYKPWTHLTEYEMYKLRKKMKKNHTWEPSDVMIRRELADRGRGWDNYYRAKAEAQANGTSFIDIDSVERFGPKAEKPDKSDKVEKADTVEVLQHTDKADKGEKPDEVHDGPEEDQKPAATPLPNPAPVSSATSASRPKTVKKTEPKKDKKPDPARSQAALAAQEAELAARRLGDIGSKFRTLFTTPFTSLASLGRSNTTPVPNRTITVVKKATDKTSKKRKAEETPASSTSPSAEPDAARKKQKTGPKPSPLGPSSLEMPTSTPVSASSEPPRLSAGTIKIPLKLTVSTANSQPSKASTPTPTTRAASVHRTSVAPKTESTPPVPSRPQSRRSTAASVEPQAPQHRPRSSATPSVAGQRLSTADAHSPRGSSATATAASRRSKRDAPGTVMQSSQDGGAAVSVSKRRTKPAKQQKSTPKPAASATAASPDVPQIRIDVDGRQEIVDPDEERYCVCGDVSWGEMICCELDEKCDYGQWFHMECVGLAELPPRTVKWYCPGDRKKYHKGENSNGLVGRGIK
ncbi:hypothetical protein ABEF95_000757 [Exophiala dermatitidis]